MRIQGYYPKEITYDRKLREVAIGLRDNQTFAERILWQELRTKQLGYKFRRQHPLHGFIVDLYCYELMLVIEIDGPVHDILQIRDAMKDRILQQHGFTVLRFTNDQVLYLREEVMKKIKSIAPS